MTQPANTRHFIYPLTLNSGFSFGRRKDITPDNFLADALAGKVNEWGLSKNYLVIQPGDWIWAYFGGKERQVHGVGMVVKPVGYRKDWQRHTVHVKWDPTLTRQLQDRPIYYEDYRQQVQSAAQRANSNTVTVLERWLGQAPRGATSGSAVQRVPRQVLQRLGQSNFRSQAVRIFGGACAVTRAREPSVLQAAHIVAVEDGGTHAPENTLLLRADVHNLFDLGFVTVTRGLTIKVHAAVEDPQYRALDGKGLAQPMGVGRPDFVASLERHRAKWQSGKNVP